MRPRLQLLSASRPRAGRDPPEKDRHAAVLVAGPPRPPLGLLFLRPPLRGYDVTTNALYHGMGQLPEPAFQHRFC